MSRGTLLLVLLLAFSFPPPDADAQQSARVYRIGFVSMRAGPEDNPQLDAFRQGLRELGYVEGRNVKTARALGLRIPQSVLVRADRIIE